jgi:hypothetical protein
MCVVRSYQERNRESCHSDPYGDCQGFVQEEINAYYYLLQVCMGSIIRDILEHSIIPMSLFCIICVMCATPRNFMHSLMVVLEITVTGDMSFKLQSSGISCAGSIGSIMQSTTKTMNDYLICSRKFPRNMQCVCREPSSIFPKTKSRFCVSRPARRATQSATASATNKSESQPPESLLSRIEMTHLKPVGPNTFERPGRLGFTFA